MVNILSFVRPKKWLSGMIIVGVVIACLPAKAWATGGYPYADYNGPGTSPKEYVWTDAAGRRYSPYGYVFRNCTDFAAWKMVSLGVPVKTVMGLGHGASWAESARKRGIAVSAEPHPWTVAVSTFPFYGHVAVVEEVRADGTIKVQEYNVVPGTYGERVGTPKQLGFGEFVHFGVKSTGAVANEGKAGPVDVMKSQGVGNEAQVYIASTQKVYESWWIPGGDGVRTNALLSPGDVKDVDKLTLSDGTQLLYAAVKDGIWESWWRPGSGLHSAKIISLENTKKVTALMQDNTHLLYVLAGDGPYEYWWRDGGDGIHKTRLAHIPNALDFVKTTGPDGAQQVYTATAGAVFETWWYPAQGVHTAAVVGIPQNNIVAVYKTPSSAGATQYLYTATTNGVWESWWQAGAAGVGNARIVAKEGVRRIEKHIQADGTHQLYIATKGEVFEYWWLPWREIRSGQLFSGTDIANIHKTTQGGFQQLYVVDAVGGYEVWWGNGRLNTVKLQGLG